MPGPDTTSRRALPRFADRITIGAQLRVSPFCLGMVTDWRVVPAAVERGVNFFFVTTDMHWPLYEGSRRGLEDVFCSSTSRREEIVVAGVCYPTQPEFCVAPFQELVSSVTGLTHVDVLVAGGSYGVDLPGRVKAFREVSALLGARAIGASFHHRPAAVDAANQGTVDICFVRYNPVHPGARTDLLPHLGPGHRPLFNFKSTMGYEPHDVLCTRGLDPELWHPEAADYYRYALSRPQMNGLLFSVNEVGHLTALENAMCQGGLLPEEEEHLEELAVLTGQNRRMPVMT